MSKEDRVRYIISLEERHSEIRIEITRLKRELNRADYDQDILRIVERLKCKYKDLYKLNGMIKKNLERLTEW